jgi:hypothetical protein
MELDEESRAEGVRDGAEVRAEIVRRCAEGESLAAVCVAVDMPNVRTVAKWMEADAAFKAAVNGARAAAGRGRFGNLSSYCQDTAEAIFQRLCDGEAVTQICKDPTMPCYSTVYAWMRRVPEFRQAVVLAYEICGERLAEAGWRAALEATPETAYLTRVRLEHLRWYAGKLAPTKYGTFKATEPPADSEAADGLGADGGGPVTNVYLKTWVIDPEGGPSRESDRPAELLYSAQAGATRDAPAVVTDGPGSGPAKAEARADRDRARGEAADAARAAGMSRFDGGVPTRFWPAWHREKYPQDWTDSVARERYVARSRIKARASHGLGPEAEDLIQADWTAAAAAEACPVRGGEGG